MKRRIVVAALALSRDALWIDTQVREFVALAKRYLPD
jgi:hypothetical protein